MRTTFKNIADFKTTLASDTDMQNAFKADPVKAAESICDTPLDTDIWIYRIIVLTLATGILLIIAGVAILMGYDKMADDKNVPIVLTAIVSAAIGALSCLLAPSLKTRTNL